MPACPCPFPASIPTRAECFSHTQMDTSLSPRLAAWSVCTRERSLLSWWRLAWEGEGWVAQDHLSSGFLPVCLVLPLEHPQFSALSQQANKPSCGAVNSRWASKEGVSQLQLLSPCGLAETQECPVGIGPVQCPRKSIFPVFLPGLAQRMFHRYPNVSTNLQTGLWEFRLTLYS